MNRALGPLGSHTDECGSPDGRGYSRTIGTWARTSARRPARPGPAQPERPVDIERVVSSRCASGACTRGAARARPVALVAARECRPEQPLRRPSRLAPRSSRSRRCARTCGVAVTKIFTSASGQITVPMSRPSSTAPGGAAAKSCWKLEQRGAHLGDRRDDRGRLADVVALQRGLVELRRIDAPSRRRSRASRVGRLMAGIEQRLRHRAIEQPGVEMAQAVMRGELLAERALAGGRRSVDGDDHERSAPRRRISSVKPGKLVAMKAASSTPTGCSLPSPITSADMAMR